MSFVQNILGQVIPVRESRSSTTGVTPLAVNGAELVHVVDGDQSCLINVVGNSPSLTLEFTGSVDGVNYFPIPATCIWGVGGTISVAGLNLITDVLATTNTLRVYQVACGQLIRVRVRISAYTSGNVDVVIRTDVNSPILRGDRATLSVTATGAAGAAVTATLPAVVGLRHILRSVRVVRSATASLTASATPVLVTTTNITGAPVLTLGQDAAGIGLDKELELDCGNVGISATATNTATTIVCPVYTGVIWRVIVVYSLDL